MKQDGQGVTVDYVVTVCGGNAARIEQFAQRLGVGTRRGWYCDARAIAELAERLTYVVPREVFAEMAAQYRTAAPIDDDFDGGDIVFDEWLNSNKGT